ncbi:MAG TPA: hypothetical protein VGF67_33195 [Ktedonobacteraceae bacterium]|jgi:hypothetical protein
MHLFIHAEGIQTLGAAQLLKQTGFYLQKRGRFAQAKTPLAMGLYMKELLPGTQHLDISDNLNLLAAFYCFQSTYEKAGQLHRRALEIRWQHLGKCIRWWQKI